MAKTLKSADLRGHTRGRWVRAPEKDQERILELPFVDKVVGTQVFFKPGYTEHHIRRRFEKALLYVTKTCDVRYHWESAPVDDQFRAALRDPERFAHIDFGSDVAEQDARLREYFLSTPAYRRCRAREKSLVIGPKGGGKTAILRSLESEANGYTVVITPEVFATSVLKKVLEDSSNVWDESEAFVSTWMFSILVEVFKRVCDQPRGKAKALQRIRVFLSDHAEYYDVDLFTRFVLRLKTIQALKVGPYEFGLKMRKLQELYALERLYSLLPDLKSVLHEEVIVLIDELDQGWDNTPHSNMFVAALVHAALKVQNLGLRMHVIAFLRSEIFDLVKYSLDQLDKLRGGIEELQWEDSQLAGLIVRRLAVSFDLPPDQVRPESVHHFFDAPVRGFSGFGYIVSRTCRRPREVLQFSREVHQVAVDSGHSRIDAAALLRAEERFSKWKFDHLCSEYKYIFPRLEILLSCFRGKGPVLDFEGVSEIIVDAQAADPTQTVPWLHRTSVDVVQHLYNVEFLGALRPVPVKDIPGILASYEFAYERPAGSIRRSPTLLIHPAFWEYLEIDSA